jgi:outer membrane receptor protein involved in Fe transport
MVYAGAYLDRNQNERNDYSDYAYWYDVCCGYGSSMVNNDGDLINPAQYIKGKDGFTMWSNELRFSSPRDKRLRFTGGLFAQSDTHHIEQRYMVNNLATEISVTGWPDTIWLTEQTRTDDSYALFGELYYDITDSLTATAGGRLFQTNNDLKGFFGFSQNFGGTGEAQCFPNPGDPNNSDNWQPYRGAPCVNLNKSTSENGVTPKFNLAYKFDEDRMVYLTYSEGFRPGGVNRRGTFPPYKADYLTNYETGWKTTWADGTVRFNGAAFIQKWDKFQYSFLGENGLTNIRNAGQAEISGIETYVDWAATDHWRFSTGATWLDPKLTKNFCQAIGEDPCTPENYAKKGTRLPVTPTFKGNVIARYIFSFSDYDGNVQGSYVYQNDVQAELLPYNRQFTGKQGAFGVADFSGSLTRGPYSLTLFINNAFDERADLFKYQECAVEVCGVAVGHPYTTYTGPNQPRTIGLIFRQEF